MKKHDNRYDNFGKYIRVITKDLVPFDKQYHEVLIGKNKNHNLQKNFTIYATCDLVSKINKVPQHNDFYAMIDGNKHILTKNKI